MGVTRASRAVRSIAFACLVLVGACGRLEERAVAEDVAAGSDDSPARAVVAPPSDAARADDAVALACANVPPAPAAGAEDASSGATSISFGGDDGRVFHRRYAVGAFASVADGGASACGDRGVYAFDDPCGFIELSACDDAGRSCIYLSSWIDPRPHTLVSAPAGHYVDEMGRCWALVDATVHLDAPATSPRVLGSAQSGTFDVIAASGTETRRLDGAFIACIAVTNDHTCK